MSARSRTFLVCSLSVLASALCPLTGAAQPAYSVIDLGKAPEPRLPEPYPPSSDLDEIEWMVGNASGQIIMSRFLSGNLGSNINSFFWEPGLAAPILIGSRFDTVIVSAINDSGYAVGRANDHPFVWSKATGQVSLQGGEFADLVALAVNSSAIAVGVNLTGASPRAIIWNQKRQPVSLNDLEIAGREPWLGFEHARTISDDGIITGIGRFTTSAGVVEPHYFALTPVAPRDDALNRTDWVASATEQSADDPPAHAIDGNINTRFSTGRAQHDSQGFQVSWPGDRTVGRIRMDVGPSTGDYPTTCGIWVTATSGQVTFVNCAVDGSGTVDVSFTPLPVQKIEVWQWGSAPAWWSIAEFNAYAK